MNPTREAHRAPLGQAQQEETPAGAPAVSTLHETAAALGRDLNNILTVIALSCDLLRREGSGSEPLLLSIRHAAQRAAGLTRHLLALVRPQGDLDRGVGKATVLLAEDNLLVRLALVQALEQAGFRVLAAEDGPAALRRAREHTGPIQALVTDVEMPGLLGTEVARDLRTTRPDLRVVFISGNARYCVLTRESGTADAVLEKPFLPESLVDLLRQLLGQPPDRT